MSLKSDIAKLTKLLKPEKVLEVRIVHSRDEVGDIDEAIWVVVPL